jgi:hypothetical protein
MKKIFIFLIILSVGLTSCSDFLIQEPVLTQSNELILSDYAGLNSATAGAYAPLQSANWYGANFILASELRGGNAKNPTNTDFTSGRYTNEYNWNFTSSATSPIWNITYYVISAANNVLNAIPSVEGDAQDKNNLKAEALFLRALSHFDLVRTYAQAYTYDSTALGVPVILVSKIDLPARNKVNEVYRQIVTDLREAETIISPSYTRSNVTDKKSVVSQTAIQALLSRVYLYMGKWQNSANYATKVINSGKYSLWDKNDYKTVWGKLTADTGGEIIFQIFGDRKNSYWGSWDDITWMVNPDGYADVASTADLRNLYDDNDVRGEMFVSHPDAADHFWTLKYPGKSGSNKQENNVVVLRLSEMYLNRAEAIYKGATIAGVTAESDLNAIAFKRGATLIASANATNLFDERRKELAFEGHIVYDYARWGKSLVRTDYQGTAINKDIPFPSPRWALPIPKRELDANPNMEPNP